ncbi:type IV pilus modification protein PilV [Pseudorhodoferax sp. Leaf267]|uniref:type IV pilus modification protein PilV n=1 Tax=Pseudorhodoferax sp. Leaf267 TaxID=1736316 RepID=UPI0006FFC094|nr:type IV pilus modification protein PilV [Pseudorhodoferax sp. Leaf267]KQP14363.1 hypothetical protein ASF43_16260 [Pseudorhodoferax sp. Leaf267]
MLTSRRPLRGQYLQTGLSLIESLVAIVVLALGVAGLAWTQARLLVDGRDANARANAILLIGDLSNRMLFNHATAASGGYRLAWGEMPTVRDCTSGCSGSELAQSDLGAWRAALARALPAGDASVFRSSDDPRQIGIAVSWSLHSGHGRATDAETAPFAVTAATHGVDCPEGQHCHVVYVQP